VNEPQWDWSDGNQEGCPYSNEQISGVVKAVDHSLTVNRLSAKILITKREDRLSLFREISREKQAGLRLL